MLFKNGSFRVRYAKTGTMAQLIALSESDKREIKYFSIIKKSDSMELS